MTNTLMNVASIKVSPGIGIGRVGNSDHYFIGPEIPGVIPDPGNQEYKDATGALKRQAQRFRVFGYDATGELLGEITNGSSVNGTTVTIDWEVHVTNMKAANYAFQGQYAFNPAQLRNSNIQPHLLPEQRTSLIIDPGEKIISGVNQGPVELLDTVGSGSTIFDIAGTDHSLSSRLQFDPPQAATGDIPVTYTSATVSLGRLYTDIKGRLIFVGGKGESACCTTPKVVISKVVVPQAEEPNPEYNGNSYFNNPGWYDDTCGGSIDAAVKDAATHSLLFKTGGIAAQRGWIAVTPPHYAPASNNVVSLLDLQLDIFPASDPYTGKGPLYFVQTSHCGIEIASSATGVATDLNFSVINSSIDSFVTPAVTTFQSKTYIAVSDRNGLSHIGVSGTDNNFTFNQITSAPATQASPALAVLDNQLFYAVASESQGLNLGVADQNGAFTFSPLTTHGKLEGDVSPSLCAFNASLYCAYASSTGELMIASSLGGAASNFVFTPLSPPSAPVTYGNVGLTVYAGQLYCGFIGIDAKFYLGHSADGSQFTFNRIGSLAPPAKGLAVTLSAFNNQLFYAVASKTPNPSTVSTQLAVSKNGADFDAFQAVTHGVESNRGFGLAAAIPVNFFRDIYPILRTVTDYAWTNERAFHGHRPGVSGDFLNPEYLATLASPESSPTKISRPFVFSFIRPPVQTVYAVVNNTTVPVKVPPPPAPAPANITNNGQTQRADLMPRLFGNGGSVSENQTNGTTYPNQWLALTNHQLEKFQQWVNGDFVTGLTTDTQWQGISAPDQHDFAALQPTTGGGFHPGIELTYLMHESVFFDSPFRFTQNTVPGSIAAYMSVPWQGDFWSCNISWWPALRPDIVVERTTDTPPVLSYTSWFRGNEIPPNSDAIDNYEGGYNIMVDTWPKFGLVTPVTGEIDQGQQVFAETERAPSLNAASLLLSINSEKESNNAVLTNTAGQLSTQASCTTKMQQWRLVESLSSASYLFIEDANGAGTLTVDFSTGNITLAARAVPQEDSQLWQYVATGYPGHFVLKSQLNLKLLSVETNGTVSTQAPSNALQQAWQLKAST